MTAATMTATAMRTRFSHVGYLPPSMKVHASGVHRAPVPDSIGFVQVDDTDGGADPVRAPLDRVGVDASGSPYPSHRTQRVQW